MASFLTRSIFALAVLSTGFALFLRPAPALAQEVGTEVTWMRLTEGTDPVVTESEAPAFPIALRDRVVTGSAELTLRVRANGRVSEARVLSATRSEFGDAAAEAARRWRFERGDRQEVELMFVFQFVDTSARAMLASRVAESPEALARTMPKYGGDDPVVPADAIDQEPIAYPLSLRREGAAGRAMVSVLVGLKGDAIKVALVNASHADFGQIALEAALKAKYRPATKGGRPVLGLVPRLFEFPAQAAAPALAWVAPPPEPAPEPKVVAPPAPRLPAAPRLPSAPQIVPVAELLADTAGLVDLRTLTAAERPQPTQQVAPVLPDGSPLLQTDGSAIVIAIVSPLGNVEKAAVRSESQPGFGEVAAKAMLQWSFSPARQGGSAVRCRVAIPFNFKAAPPPSDDPDQIVATGMQGQKLDVQPVLISKVAPSYPGGIPFDRQISGILMSVVISKEGEVVSTSSVVAAAIEFTRAADSAVRRWKFKPAEIAGQPVSCKATLVIAFKR